jgi:hypothetical protein
MDREVRDMRETHWILVLILSGLVSCNYTDGACWARPEGGGVGGVGGAVIVPSGGLGDTPPPPGDAPSTADCNYPAESGAGGDSSTEAGLKVFCKTPDHGPTCSELCLAKQVPCVPFALHPYKSDGGVGKLFSCNDLWIGYMCGYHYPNGDDCYYPFGNPFPKVCSYSGNN